MNLESWLRSGREIPFEDAASYHNILRRPPQQLESAPQLSKEAGMGILKLMLAKHAQGEEAEAMQAALMTDPQVQQALDHQAAVAQAQHSTQQLLALQQQMEGMQQGMQQLQQQAEQTGQQLQMTQQENSQLQEQLQGEMQMRQQSNMQAMQAQDQAINTKAMAQKQRHELSQMADQMSLQLKQVAAQDPEQAQMQQEQAAQQQQAMEQEQAKAALPPKQRKEVEEAEKAQQNAQVQSQQAEQAQAQAQQQGPMAQAMEQQAAAAQQQQAAQQAAPPEGGMVAQSSAGMRKMDILRHKLKTASTKGLSHSINRLRGAYGSGRTMANIKKKGRVGKWLGTHKSEDLKAVGMSLPERAAYRTGEHRDKLLAGGAGVAGLGTLAGLAAANREKRAQVQQVTPGGGPPPGAGVINSGPSKTKFSELGKCAKCGGKVKHGEMTKHTCSSMPKLAMVPPPTSAMKARLLEAGLGAGLGAMTGAAYEAGRQRFSNQPPTQPSAAEIALERKNRAAQIKQKESPTLINRLAATKTQAQLDVEKDMRKHPKKAVLRRALQGAVVGSMAAPTASAVKRNLSPRIMG